VHGADAVRRVTKAAAILFGGSEIRDADAATLAMVIGEVATHSLAAGELAAPMLVVDALCRAGLAASKSEARRGLASGGFSVNGVVADETRTITTADLLPGGVILLRKGKKHWAALAVRSPHEARGTMG
jgi:tyrosyl-tRNA synthetase